MRSHGIDLFHDRPRRRPGRWMLLLVAVPLVAAGGVAVQLGLEARHPTLPVAGVGEHLELTELGRLPDWARSAVHDLQLGPDYQFVATAIDLNRDEQPEILLAPAPPRPDLFIPESALRVLIYQDGHWEMDDTGLACRPGQIGSFVTREWWDLRCRTARGEHVLRWTGFGYREAG